MPCPTRCGYHMTETRQCSRRTCKYAQYCWQHAKKVVGLQIRKSRIQGAGQGLFAARNFPSDSIVAYYGGRYFQRRKNIPVKYDDYVLQIDGGGFLEHSRPQDGYARWVNHCRAKDIKDGNCEGNNTDIVATEDKKGAFLKVKPEVEIQRGDEIFTSYGTNYWNQPPRKKPERTKRKKRAR